VMGQPTEVFELDVDTGELSLLHTIDMNAGELDGLVALDTTTLLAASYDGLLTTIHLENGNVSTVSDPTGGKLVGIDNDSGNIAYAIEESNNEICRVTLPSFARTCVPLVGGFTVLGGGLARAPNGQWYGYTNTSRFLAVIDVDTGMTTAMPGGNSPEEELTGLVFGPDGVLRGIARSSNELIEIDRDTGFYTKRTPLCRTGSCPTVFDIEFGDLALGR